ncbi:MAG TPA: CHRD domain-containing protein [Pseudonocardiaceae bacterium]|jgi:hypothetical protein|nr:CHRD domain-containing protein [Pseudonocardiaceae bacterium]
MRLPKTPLVVGVLAAALSGGAAVAVVATSSSRPTTHPEASLTSATGPSDEIFLEADLSGHAEAVKSAAAGDPHGTATEILRIKGTQVSYAITWQNLSSPTAVHVQQGADTAAGPVAFDLLGNALPDTVTSVLGTITVPDAPLLARLITAPSQFYGNLGTGAYPSGAVRGQFRRIAPVDLTKVLRIGQFEAVGSGDQEVPMSGMTNAGDQAAHSVTHIGIGSGSLSYATTWSGVSSPTAENINSGMAGANGDLAATLFSAPHGLPASVTAVAGTVPSVPASALTALKAGPAAFHTNLLTAQFPTGAARGQLFATMSPTPTTKPVPTTPTTKPTATTTAPTTTKPAPPTKPTMTPTTKPTETTTPGAPVTTTGSIPTDPGNHW